MTQPRADFKKIWEECKANHARLDGCAGPHDFVKVDRRESVCSKCQGRLNNIEVFWYTQGLKHGGAVVEKRAVIEEGLTPPEEKVPEGTKQADKPSLEEHTTKRLQEAAEGEKKLGQ